MAIMVAGGLTFAVPSTMPAAYAEVTTSNPHLYVSAEGQDADNQFAQGNIIEVIIRDDSIGDTDEGEAEPDVSINGADLRMLQTANGDWRAYFAQADAIAAIDAMKGELDYGVYCNAINATSVAEGKVNLRDTNGAYFPPGSVNNTVHDTKCKLEDAPKADPDDPNHPLIRETRDLTNPSTSGLGQLGFADEDLWPFIQVFDFAPESKVNVVYNKGGTQETVTLEFDDPSESHSLDRTKYPQGAHVLVTIEDYALNIDPTDEDTWAFNTDADSKAAYYNLFDEDGNAVNIMNDDITDYGGKAGIGERIVIERSGQGGKPLIDCQVTADFGIVDEENTSKDYLMSNDDGECVTTNKIESPDANAIFADGNFVIGFVEDGSNNNKFINWADDQRSNLVVRDDAQRNRSFEIDYNDPGAISGVVGHFFAELTLGDAGATWNSGERIGITVTDEDVNTNPLAENDLTVANPDSKLIPSIKIGSPITLASASGNVVWYDLENDPEPPAVPTPDTTPPTISVTGGAFMVSNTTTNATSTYVDEDVTCTDDDGTDRPVTTTITRNSTGITTNAVDLNDPDTYILTYSCADAVGNPAASMTRTVTVTSDPVITVHGANPKMVAEHATAKYMDDRVSCEDDNHDGNIARITNNASSIDRSQLGYQTITYTCTDMEGNMGTATRTVKVTDQIMPKITILGKSPVEVDQDDVYMDDGAECVDGRDGHDLSVTTTNTIDTSMVGNQTVTYECTDLQTNSANATRTVTVVDVTDPVISFDQDPVMESSHNTETYADTGVTCVDAVDGAITTITSNATGVDRANPDSYVIEYSCTDNAENTATKTRIVTVEDDNDAPKITGTDTPVTLSRDTVASYAMMKIVEGVECTDNLDSNPTLENDHTDSVVLATNDIYTVEFKCTDENNNEKIETRTVTVQDDTVDPTVTFADTFSDTVEQDTSYDATTGVSCDDDVSARLHVSGDVDTTQPGTNAVVYTCVDDNGNSDAVVKTITVTATNGPADTNAPTITLRGQNPMTLTQGTAYDEPGADCVDDVDGTSDATPSGTVDHTAPDTYTITYNCMDSSSNTAASVTRTVEVVAPQQSAPLEITSVVVPTEWTGDANNATMTIRINGYIEQESTTPDVSQAYGDNVLVHSSLGLWAYYDRDGTEDYMIFFNDSDSNNYIDTTISNDGTIIGIIELDVTNHQDLADKQVTFILGTFNATAAVLVDNRTLSGDTSVYSNNVTEPIHALPGAGTSVDMTTTPVSGNTAEFPPITRAVINDVSAIPAVHQVQQSSNTYPMEKYTWSVNNPRDINDCDDLSTFTDKYCVEKFSDRLRLSHDSNDMTSISGNSKIVIYDWDAPTFDGGVTTLFNWNFDSISHADVINVTLAQYGNHSNNQTIAIGSDDSPKDITSMRSNIEALGDKVDLVIMLKDTKYGHICDDITLVADFFTFGQTSEGDRVNNAIYRIEVEEVTPDNSDFAGTLEYVMLNQLNYDDSATYTSLRTIDVDASIIVHEDFTDEDSVRINYFDLGADGVATQIAVQQEAPTHSGVVSFDDDNYKIADTVTITLEDADLNVDNDVVDIYTFDTSDNNPDMIGDANAFILDVTFDDELWTGTCGDNNNVRGFASTGFTLMETASNSGIFTGDFQVPSEYCQSSTDSAVSVTGVDIEVNYYDFRDASGETIKVGDDAAVRANTGTVSLDRTVYPVPFDPAKYGTATDNSLAHNDYEDYNISGDLGVHIRVNDPDFDVSASGQDKIVNASEYLTVMIIRGADTKPIFLNDTDTVGDLNRDGVKEILEVKPDAGVFELDLTIAHNSGPAQGCPTELRGGCILQGDIIQVEYRDKTDASGEENTITDSATFDLRNAVLQSDKSVYLIGSNMILTLIEPDFDLDNDGAETYPLDLIEWDSDADTVAMGSDDRFVPKPNGLRETGDSTGIFQSIIEIPAVLGTNDRLERGEEIELEYVDYGPSGSDYIGDETEDINLTVATSNFGATVELDQKVYSWTDKVYITIVAPDHNFDSASVDEIGDSNLDPIKIATRSADIDNYKLVETGPDTGIFTGEVILIGYDHNADGDTSTGTESTGYDNPQRKTSGTDSGPTNGFIETDDEGGITVSFEFSEDETVVGSALIRWNIGEVQWLEASYPATGTGVVRVIDPDMNLNPESVDNFEVDIWSDKDAGGIDLTVTETNQATGIFEGTVFFTVADESSGHRLRVAEGNTVTAEYDDNTLPDPYTTADELGVTATTLIGSIVPPLERVPASNLRIVDAFENSLDSVSVDQQVQIVADITNAQERSQEFAYLVQVQDENGVTVSLAWISGTLEAGQSLSPSSSWIPTDAGEYTATAFVWESVDNPTALSPPVTTTITVS